MPTLAVIYGIMCAEVETTHQRYEAMSMIDALNTRRKAAVAGCMLLWVVAAFLCGCTSTKFGSGLHYKRLGMSFFSWTQDGREFTELTIDCRRNERYSFWLFLDDSKVAEVWPRGCTLRLDSCGFEKKDSVWRLSFDGGFAEVRMRGDKVDGITINKSIADKGPSFRVVINLGCMLPAVVTVPMEASQIRAVLGKPDIEGRANCAVK